jgi:hypothetical protein
MLVYEEQALGEWVVPAVLLDPEDLRLTIQVRGIIGNSVPTSETGKRRLVEWKRTVAAAAFTARGAVPLDPKWIYSISVGFSFHLQTHGGQTLDVENSLKPTFDALAAGLFCAIGQDPRAIERYNFDDSNFRYLFVHRLSDAHEEGSEGAGLVVSVRKRTPGLGV